MCTNPAGIITKAVTMHPHKAAKNIGVVALKRLKCTGTTCTTFKAFNHPCVRFVRSCDALRVVLQTAMCIKSDKNHFASIREEDATDSELKDFADYVKANAWDNAGTSTAKLKTGWGCSGDDLKKAQAFVSAL